MLSPKLVRVIAVMCTLSLAQASEFARAEEKSPVPLVQVNFYGNLPSCNNVQGTSCDWLARTGEALCPYCAKFIDIVAATIHHNGVMNITSFHYIPYGNAQDTKAS